MKHTSLAICLILLAALGAPVLAKSTTQLENGDNLTVVDATAGGAFAADPHDFTYFSFESGDVVALTDAEAEQSAEWHIAFKRSEIRLNGGISGPGQVRGFDINGAEDMAASTQRVELNFTGPKATGETTHELDESTDSAATGPVSRTGQTAAS